MSRSSQAIVTLALFAFLPGDICAQDDQEYLAPVTNRGVLQAKVGRGSLATLPAEVERVALADEGIARIQIISAREVLFTGLKAGRTTVFVWLTDGRRFRYLLQVDRDLDLLRRLVREVDSRIAVENSHDGGLIILRGDVDDARTSREAVARTTKVLGNGQLMNLLRYPGFINTRDDWLREGLKAIDDRIEVRRIQVGPELDETRDSFVLEGRVKNVQALERAIALAERQLGGTGVQVKAATGRGVGLHRNLGFGSGVGGLGGGIIPATSLVGHVARGLLLTSESGRVLSLLKVDELPQIMVSIRVLEVDRTKAKRTGINYRFGAEDFAIGSFTGPQAVGGLNALGTTQPKVSGGGNIIGAFVDKTTSIVAAIDFLEDRSLARAVVEPNILTLSGEIASVEVGGEVPIPTTSSNQSSTFSGFQFQRFGVRLDVRPTIDDESMVTLEVSPSIIRPNPALGSGGVPGFSVQTVTTTARIQANQSLILGGLMRFEEGVSDSGIPGLRKIPIGLFSWKQKSRKERELLFVITPRLIITKPTRIVEPIEQPDFNTMELPELEWPKSRRGWRKDFDPSQLRPDGLPPTFVPGEDEGYEYEFYDENGNGGASVTYETDPEVVTSPSTTDIMEEGTMEEAPQTQEETTGLDEVEAAVWDSQGDALPQIRIVSADPCLNLRLSPGVSESPIDCLPMGTVVEVLELQGVWGRVRLDNGQEGWMALSYLITRDQLNDAGATIDTGAGGMVSADEFAMLLSRQPEGNHQRGLQLETGTALAQSDQSMLEAQLKDLQAGIMRAQYQAAAVSH